MRLHSDLQVVRRLNAAGHSMADMQITILESGPVLMSVMSPHWKVSTDKIVNADGLQDLKQHSQ